MLLRKETKLNQNDDKILNTMGQCIFVFDGRIVSKLNGFLKWRPLRLFVDIP